MPLQLRDTYRRLASCSDPAERDMLQEQSLAQRKNWVRDLHIRSMKSSLDKGRIPSRSKKLFHVKSLFLQDGQHCVDPASICNAAAAFFGRKLGNSNSQLRSLVLDFVYKYDGFLPTFTEVDVEVCIARLRKRNRLDSEGCCVDALEIMFEQDRGSFTHWLREVCSSTAHMSQLVLRGKFYSKVSSCSKIDKLRAIFPQHSLAALIDSVLALCLQQPVNRVLPISPGLFFGGRPRTQSLDIARAAALVLEHGIDCWGECEWGQFGIRSYYDELPVLRVANFLSARGCNAADVSAAVQHQLVMGLEFEFHGCVVPIPVRSRGGVTGTRIASLLQRIRVEHTYSATAFTASIRSAMWPDQLGTQVRPPQMPRWLNRC